MCEHGRAPHQPPVRGQAHGAVHGHTARSGDAGSLGLGLGLGLVLGLVLSMCCQKGDASRETNIKHGCLTEVHWGGGKGN